MKEYAWAIVNPDGRIRADSEWQTESAAWLDCCGIAEPETASLKAMGYRAIRVRLVEVGPA